MRAFALPSFASPLRGRSNTISLLPSCSSSSSSSSEASTCACDLLLRGSEVRALCLERVCLLLQRVVPTRGDGGDVLENFGLSKRMVVMMMTVMVEDGRRSGWRREDGSM